MTTLQGCLKRLYEDEDLYVVWPYQQKTLHDIWGSIEELARLAEGTGENQLENTLGLIAHRFGDIMETIEERVPRSQVEGEEGGAS